MLAEENSAEGNAPRGAAQSDARRGRQRARRAVGGPGHPHRDLRLGAGRQHRSTSSSSAPTPTRPCPASTTSTAAACRRCPATTACTGPGAGSSPPRAWPWPWSISATPCAPSSAPEVAPFPAGLNDCVSGLKWVHANAARLDIDPARIVVAGESGGGNLTLATGLKLQAGRRHRPDQGPLRPLPLHRRPVADAARAPRRPRTTASCSTCTTIAAPWATASRRSTPRTRWPGRASPPPRTSRACRRW